MKTAALIESLEHLKSYVGNCLVDRLCDVVADDDLLPAIASIKHAIDDIIEEIENS